MHARSPVRSRSMPVEQGRFTLSGLYSKSSFNEIVPHVQHWNCQDCRMFFKFKLPSEILFAQLRSIDVTVCIIGMLCLDIRLFDVITFIIYFFPYWLLCCCYHFVGE